MVHLSNEALRRLFSYRRTRDGTQVPNTITGNIYDYACWNWVLSGGTLTASDFKSSSSIINNVLEMTGSGYPISVKPDAKNQYPGNDADFALLPGLLQAAQDEPGSFKQDNVEQCDFLRCLVRIMLRVNGLTPIAFSATNRYNVIVRSSDWWNTDHWALKLYLKQDATQFIQTVPELPLKFSCSNVWDEDLPFVEISIAGLHQNQVDQLDAVQFSTCRGWVTKLTRTRDTVAYLCQAELQAGGGQCGNCAFVACQHHLGSYDNADVFKWGLKNAESNYQCQFCRRGVMQIFG
ncbi:hypothetical protein ACQR18_29270 [Bradyrhizobium oligotrophicum]|uniref:hypothetical protein n=1 Tax=Bradyrhizobium oligotrophicum TaxID=44255 RepID=UPI003EBBF5BD